RYDRLAYLLSFGQDRRWRRAVVDHAAAAAPQLVLDVATGPAGVALAVAARTGADVVGVDLNEPLLRAGLPQLRRPGVPGRGGLAPPSPGWPMPRWTGCPSLPCCVMWMPRPRPSPRWPGACARAGPWRAWSSPSRRSRCGTGPGGATRGWPCPCSAASPAAAP